MHFDPVPFFGKIKKRTECPQAKKVIRENGITHTFPVYRQVRTTKVICENGTVFV
ncbi:hypothetical protein JCM6292_2265 [Bacteroides pyogenes JCM 6292]|uniref:Uncharacterized protein n=2 Tax=Bacteroides pyogenes TaxID=310300 RepID=W4PF54_9BACE|nr:hypothetical protein JCM6292_2265 [Bacteroides pyogenes JCM 6292]GAE17809.1 hypothetical protein JCM6294_609 [Bacteroides pyogenes DSM 20611 = JCM 6294]